MSQSPKTLTRTQVKSVERRKSPTGDALHTCPINRMPKVESALLWVVVFGGASLVAVQIVLSPNKFVFDEVFYMKPAYFLLDNGSLLGLLKEPLSTSAGPLYAMFHVGFYHLTGFDPHAVRFLNLFTLLLAIGVVGLTARRACGEIGCLLASAVMSLPMVSVAAGMTLTQVPALLMAALSILCFQYCVDMEGDAPPFHKALA